MKLAIVSAIAIAAAAGPVFAKAGPEVEIRHAVARVAVVVEDRTDIAVEIEQGSSGLPAVQVTRDGADVRIDGGLGGRRGLFGRGDGLRNCRSGPDNARQPGEGASVEVRSVGRVNLADAPLIVIRTPRNVNVDASGAVFGSVGRGSASIELGNAGCGDWNVANSDGRVSLAVSGSGDIRAGTSSALEASISGAGSITAGATRGLEVSLSGAGDVIVARVDGPTEISIAGAGDVAVRAGTAPTLSISIAGVGDVDFDGVAGDVDVSLAGAGDVNIARATGSVSRSVAGVGDIRIGD
ncbi:MAG: GIN domain-containing protein [Brevundimonas sp.]